MRAHKDLTVTIRVEEFLRARDDFATARDVQRALSETSSRVSAALHHLRKFRVADVVIEPDGVGWWFALPAAEDKRSSKQIERTPESKPRSPRRSRRARPAKDTSQ